MHHPINQAVDPLRVVATITVRAFRVIETPGQRDRLVPYPNPCAQGAAAALVRGLFPDGLAAAHS